MGVYAHRFIEVLGKDNKWQLVPLWSKYREDSYSQPDVVAGDLKLRKYSCFLRRASSGFYSTGSLYSVEDISHSVSPDELSEETRKYVEGWEYPVRWECFSLTELGDFIADSRIDVWIYGHSHTNIDTTIGNTRIVCNQLGYIYYNEHLKNGFGSNKVIEL